MAAYAGSAWRLTLSRFTCCLWSFPLSHSFPGDSVEAELPCQGSRFQGKVVVGLTSGRAGGGTSGPLLVSCLSRASPRNLLNFPCPCRGARQESGGPGVREPELQLKEDGCTEFSQSQHEEEEERGTWTQWGNRGRWNSFKNATLCNWLTAASSFF